MKKSRAAAWIPCVAIALSLAGCSTAHKTGGNFPPTEAPVSGLSKVPTVDMVPLQRIPHDKTRFTQGLEFIGPDTMVESTGIEGRSKVYVYQVSDQLVIKEASLPADQFGEGITMVGNRLINLTWKNQTANVWTLPDLKPAEPLKYEGEGWGLCYDPDAKIVWMSNGSDSLTARDPDTFEVIRSIKVTADGQPIERINELECVAGKVWANVWQTNRIIAIDPTTGHIEGKLELSSIAEIAQQDNQTPFSRDQVLNGLAYHEPSDTWFITGKQWPYLYQIAIGKKAAEIKAQQSQTTAPSTSPSPSPSK